MSDDALILRTVEETEPLDNKRGVTYRVQVVGGGGGSVDYSKTVQKTTTMPTADSSNAGDVYMYTGATDANYTTNYIYENITTTTSSSASATQTVGSGLSNISVDIDILESFTGWTTDNSLQIFYTADGWSVDTTSLGVTYTGTPSVGDAITITYTAEVNTYAWTRVDVQPAPSGLPDQTGQSGKFLTTDGTDASWSDKPLVNTATGANSITILGTATTQSGAINIGKGSYASATNAISLGYNARISSTGANNSVLIGNDSWVGASYAIQLGHGSNYDASTFKVGLSANGNYELMSADGTIPTARLTKVNTTITLTSAGWSSNTQTVNVTGMTATGVVFVSPDPTDQSAYTSAGILCTAQAAGSLEFTCDTVPSGDIDVNVVML